MAIMRCSRCGSDKVMSNLRIRDANDIGAEQDLEVEIQGNPDALVFKQPHREALRATVCGECGNTALCRKSAGTLETLYTREKFVE